MSLRIFLADDHGMFREGVRLLLESQGFSVVGEAADGLTAAKLAAELHADIAVLDVAMPRLNGVDAARSLKTDAPDVKTILLSVHTEEPYVIEGLRAGVRGYVMKTQAGSELVQAIREVARGAIYLSPGISGLVVDACLTDGAHPRDPLTLRERQVLQLVAEGNSTKEVAGLLGIGARTAESHRLRIMKKLGIHETATLVRYAVRQGLVEP